MLLTILGVIVFIAAVLVIVIATRPSDFRVERTAIIQSPAAAVFAEVNDFKRWAPWSPWEKRDPNTKRTYSGAESGVGAAYAWAGNREVGEGRMTIVESKLNELIRIKIEFLKPFASTNEVVFAFVPEGEGTRVTWSIAGKNNFTAKAMDLLMNMDKMIGRDFEKGLTELKGVVEHSTAG